MAGEAHDDWPKGDGCDGMDGCGVHEGVGGVVAPGTDEPCVGVAL
jgi:hypothetical protein